MSNTTPLFNKKLSKKDVRKLVYDKLANALSEYKTDIKEKRFASNLKKASKLFATDIAKAISKKSRPLKKTAKKMEQA